MGHLGKGRLSYANVVSSIALFVALGGVSYAAVTLPRNSVGSPQIKKGAVRGADLGRGAVDSGKVKDGTLQATDLAASARAALKGAPGAAGAAGAPGSPGAPGAAGKDAPTADLSLTHSTAVTNNSVFTHTFKVANAGPGDTWAVLTFRQADREWVTTFPTQPEIVCSAKESEPGLRPAAYVYCVLGTLPAGTSKTFTLVNGGCAAGTRTATATLTATLADPTPGDLTTTSTYTNQDCAG